MKTSSKILMMVAALAATTAGANAGLFDNAIANQSYIGLKAGKFRIDPKDEADKSNPTAFGIYSGYNFDPNWAAETEYVGSNKADVKINGYKLSEVKDQTFGLYGAYRYNFGSNLYAKAKLGVARNKIKFSDSGYSTDSSKTGLAGGIGLGYNISPKAALELEYDKLPTVRGVNSTLLTLGGHIKF